MGLPGQEAARPVSSVPVLGQIHIQTGMLQKENRFPKYVAFTDGGKVDAIHEGFAGSLWDMHPPYSSLTWEGCLPGRFMWKRWQNIIAQSSGDEISGRISAEELMRRKKWEHPIHNRWENSFEVSPGRKEWVVWPWLKGKQKDVVKTED